MAIPSKFYLDEAGLRALIAKIKAGDATNAEEIARILNEVIGTGTPDPEGTTINDRIAGLAAAIADLASGDDDINDHLDEVEELAKNAFKDVEADNDIEAQNLRLTFKREEGEDLVVDIDTTDFIVHGMLKDAKLVNAAQIFQPDPESEDQNVYYIDGDTKIKADSNVYRAVWPDYHVDEETGNAIWGDKRDDVKFLLLTFDVHPEANDNQTIHQGDPDVKHVWVDVDNLVDTYTFNIKDSEGNTSDLITVTSEGYTVNIATSAALEQAVEHAEAAYEAINDAENGLEPRVAWLEEHAANEPLSTAQIDTAWAETQAESNEPEPDPEP